MRYLLKLFKILHAPIWVDQSINPTEKELSAGSPGSERCIRNYEIVMPNCAYILFIFINGLNWTCWFWPYFVCLGITLIFLSIAIRNRYFSVRSSQKTTQFRNVLLLVNIVNVGFLGGLLPHFLSCSVH